MKASSFAWRRQATAMLWALALLAAGAAQPGAAAERVRVEVATGEVVRNSAPALFGFGGNIWWTPEVFSAGVAERILGMPHLGMTRLSLGDQVLQHATSLEDLKRRLAELPLNDFLRKYKAAGGKVLLILDGTPRWISADKSTELKKGPNLPIFRGSPPSDFRQWADVVEAVVRHFNGKLGLNAYYEAWNEPNYFYYGSSEQFFRQYMHTVLGARRADPRALVGGPCASEFMGATTGGETVKNDADKLRITEQVMDHRYFFRQFLDYAASTPLPELGMARLPLDFFSWHTFYIDPTRYYAATVPYIRAALAKSGYPEATPIFTTEWNIAADPPYPEGDLNATEAGAAFVATSLIAMNEAGVDAQAFQMYVDPGVKGNYGGMFTNWGVPRASFQVFRLFSMLRGKQVRSSSSDPWVKSVAFADGDTIYLMVSSMVPSPKMLKDSQATLQNIRNESFTRSLVRERLVESVVKGAPLPPARANQVRQIEAEGEQSSKDNTDRAASRKAGVSLEIALAGLKTPRQVRRYLIDSQHANAYPQLAKATRLLEDEERRGEPMPSRIQQGLAAAAIPRRSADSLVGALRGGKPLDEAIDAIPDEHRGAARRAVEQVVSSAVAQRKRLLEEIENAPGAGLREEPVSWPEGGTLRIDIEPQTAVLFILQR